MGHASDKRPHYYGVGFKVIEVFGLQGLDLLGVFDLRIIEL